MSSSEEPRVVLERESVDEVENSTASTAAAEKVGNTADSAGAAALEENGTGHGTAERREDSGRSGESPLLEKAGFRSKTTYEMMSLACALPKVEIVFERLERTDNGAAQQISENAWNILKLYCRQGGDCVHYLQRIASGQEDPRQRKVYYGIDGGQYGVVQQGSHNTLAVNAMKSSLPSDDVTILQQGIDNAININVELEASRLKEPAYRSAAAEGSGRASPSNARATIVGDLLGMVKRCINVDLRNQLSLEAELRGPESGQSIAATAGDVSGRSDSRGTPVDAPDMDDDDSYTVSPSSLFAHDLCDDRDALGDALGLSRDGPVRVKDVQTLEDGRLRVALSERQPPTGSGEPSTLVMMKIRGPLVEFEQKKHALRRQLSATLNCPSTQIQFLRATRAGSVLLLAAMPVSALGRLLELALTRPSVLRALGIFSVLPSLHPATINVGDGVDITMTCDVLGAGLCQVLSDALFDSQHLSVEQHENLKAMTSLSHLMDRLVNDGVPINTVLGAAKDAQSSVVRCLRNLKKVAAAQDDGNATDACSLVELVVARFQADPVARRHIDIPVLAKILLDDYLGHGQSASVLMSVPSRPVVVVVVDTRMYCATFLQTPSPSYRPSAAHAGRKAMLRLDTNAEVTERSLLDRIAVLCSLQLTDVSVRKLEKSPAASDVADGSSATLSFVVLLPSVYHELLVKECRHGAVVSVVAKALADQGVLSVKTFDEPSITLQPGAHRERGARPSLLRSFRSRFSRSKKTSSELEIVLAARRHQIMSYQLSDSPVAARFHLAGVSTSDVSKINIAFIGPPGVGKSALINTIASVVEQRAMTPCKVREENSDAGPCTKRVGDGLAIQQINLIDTPPMVVEHGDSDESVDAQMKLFLHGVLEGRLNKNEDLHNLSPARLDEIINCKTPAKPIEDQVHAVVFVFDGRVVPTDGDFTRRSLVPPVLGALRARFAKPRVRFRGMEPAVVVTHCHKPLNDRQKDAVVHWSRAMAGARFYIDNKPGQDLEHMPESLQLDAMETVTMGIQIAEQFILRQKQHRQDEQLRQEQQLSTEAITDSTQIDTFLSKTLGGYGFNKNKMLALRQSLQAHGIGTKRHLADQWQTVRDLVPRSPVMLDKLEAAMGLPPQQMHAQAVPVM